jgi:hypothetical protein
MMYSAIGIDDRREVISKCYWPLLKFVENGLRTGIQLSGLSLEIINGIDSHWVKTFKALLSEGKCELIGNGYSQVIAPLVPSRLNSVNQRIGKNIYSDLLGIKPTIATVNEMAYSSGIVDHFIDSGYDAVMMEWNNPRRLHPEWHDQTRFHPQTIVKPNKRSIELLWVDSIVFQKFQRYVHGDSGLDEYLAYLKNMNESSDQGNICLYASDTEIFDYRPRRYKTETTQSVVSEWERISSLFEHLEMKAGISLNLPREILESAEHEHSHLPLRLESAENPTPVKKQEKYNLYRWALTGRDDLSLNTKCKQIYDALAQSPEAIEVDWKELLFLWSSDYRTHIEENRWTECQQRLNILSKKYLSDETSKNSLQNQVEVKAPFKTDTLSIRNMQNKYLQVKTIGLDVVFNQKKGLTVKACKFDGLGDIPIFGTIDHGWYDSIQYSADYYSGHTVIEIPGKHKISNLNGSEPKIYHSLEHICVTDIRLAEGIGIETKYTISNRELIINKKLGLTRRIMGVIHPLILTFNPSAFDRTTLYFETMNGGLERERYMLDGQEVDHSQSLSHLISAKYGLGATEGIVIIGDKDKQVIIRHDQSKSMLLPQVIYKEFSDNYFLRLQYSAQEIDETFKENDNNEMIEAQISISMDSDN